MARTLNGRGRKRRLAKAWLLDHPGATNDDVVKACDVSHRLVTTIRTELRQAGLMKPAAGDRTSKPILVTQEDREQAAAIPEVTVRSTEDLMRMAQEVEAISGHEWSIDDQLALMRLIANNPNEGTQARIAATVQYNKIKADLGARDALGPGKPLTDEDRVLRLSLLMQACGLRLVKKALEMAFKKDVTDGESQKATLAPNTTHTSTEIVDTSGSSSTDFPTENSGESPMG